MSLPAAGTIHRLSFVKFQGTSPNSGPLHSKGNSGDPPIMGMVWEAYEKGGRLLGVSGFLTRPNA